MNGNLSKLLPTVVVTLLVAWIASIQKSVSDLHSGESRAEISRQIQTEAPWVTERTFVLGQVAENSARLTMLEGRATADAAAILKLESALAQVESLDRFFCRTRAPSLPTC